MVGHNKLLNTKGVPMLKGKPSSIPSIAPVDRKEANIEAEKGETILKPDGELGKFLGKKHSKTSNAGTPAQVEPGSFIYSDKIKLPKEFGTTVFDKEVNKVSKVASGELTLKIPTKMYLDVLRDEKSDERAKNTADIMLKKNLQGLQVVFEAQQMFKEDNGIQEGTMMANGGYLPKAANGNDPYASIRDFVAKYSKNKESQWLTDKPKSQYLYQSAPEFEKFVTDPNSWEFNANPKKHLTKSSPLVQQQYQGQNFYKNGEYDTSPEGKYARINQHFAYNDGTSKGTKGKSTYNYMSTMLQNDKEKTALLPENAPAWYQTDLQNKGYKLIDPKYIEGMSKEDLLQAGYDGRTIYNNPKRIKKGLEYKAMFDPSNTRENNDAIGDIKDPRYKFDPYPRNLGPLDELPDENKPIDTSQLVNDIVNKKDTYVSKTTPEITKSKPTQLRDYVTEAYNQRKAQLYSRMFDQDRLPYMPHYNQAVPYQRATPISYAPTLAGLRAGSDQLDNSNTPDQIKGAVFSDYLSKAQDQIGKIDVQNQSNNAQVTQQNLNAFVTGINQNQQTNNQYKQNYDQLVQNQEQARTNRKYTLQDAIAELNSKKAERDFDYELMNADPTSNYNVTQQNKGIRNYITFDWKERNRLNTINSDMLNSGSSLQKALAEAIQNKDFDNIEKLSRAIKNLNGK